MSSPIELDKVKQFPVEISRLLHVPVENFQDSREITWHLLRCTGAQLWRSTGQSRKIGYGWIREIEIYIEP